ncbi:MAG: tight adherence protein [Aliidongia sp.]|jgi:tight adherence protein C|nr:tight adherence protein [Aliidongia sp.]
MIPLSLGTMSILFLILAALGIFAGFIGLDIANRRERLRMRIAAVSGEARGASVRTAPGAAIAVRLQTLGRSLLASPLLGTAEREKLAGKLANGGLRDPNALSIFVGVKFGLTVTLPILVWLGLTYIGMWPGTFLGQLPLILGTTWAGWRIPDMWIDRRINEWRLVLADSLPDALDLMVICTDAGLGMEQALDRVAHDLANSRPVLAAELHLTLAEMRVLPQIRDALTNLAARTQSRPIQLLVGTLVQTLQYGTPLGQSLRTLSAEMHIHRFLQYEANAAKLPVMLTLPMVIFILPTMFLVIGGPAVLKVIDTIKTL